MSLHEDARKILERVVTMTRLIHSIEQHLIAEQQEAIGPRAQDTSKGATGKTNAISDPTAAQALSAVMAPFAKQYRTLHDAMRAIDKSLDRAERDASHALGWSYKPNVIVEDEERCPGWNEELRRRLGGCGKPMEFYTTAGGVKVTRATRLCMGCRKASERAETLSHDCPTNESAA